MKSAPGLVCVIIAFGGCASQSTVNLPNRTASSADIHQTVASNQSRIQSLRGEGKISVETTDIAQTASFEIDLLKPDSIMLKVEGPFGIDVGSALVTREEFLFYNILQNKVFSGSTSPANLGRFFRLDIAFEDFMNLFLGGSFLTKDLASPEEISVESNQFVVTHGDANGRSRYWVDPNTLLIIKIEHLDSEGRMFLEERFENHKVVDGISIPHFIQVTQTKERRRVSISYSRVETNSSSNRLTITVPQSAERIRIQ